MYLSVLLLIQRNSIAGERTRANNNWTIDQVSECYKYVLKNEIHFDLNILMFKHDFPVATLNEMLRKPLCLDTRPKPF